MSTIWLEGNALIAGGELGYEQAGDFAGKCAELLGRRPAEAAVIDLRDVRILVSPCLAAIYDNARAQGLLGLMVIAPRHLAHLFAPGEEEGLFDLQKV